MQIYYFGMMVPLMLRINDSFVDYIMVLRIAGICPQSASVNLPCVFSLSLSTHSPNTRRGMEDRSTCLYIRLGSVFVFEEVDSRGGSNLSCK